jgi:hypothetical protein
MLVMKLKAIVELIRVANFLNTKFLPPNKKRPQPNVVTAPLVILMAISP